jgi:hypothetical protein
LNDVNATGLKVENVNLGEARVPQREPFGCLHQRGEPVGPRIEDANLDGMTINGVDVVPCWTSGTKPTGG